MNSKKESRRFLPGWLDTNVILRFLLNDHSEHSPRAKGLIERAERGEIVLRVAQHIVCEAVYVLETLNFTRKDICEALTEFARIPGTEVENATEVMMALIWYRDKNIDFSDALLYAISSLRGETVWTFNKNHFRKMGPGWTEP